MKRIVIVCGGTGSIALQTGFDAIYGINNYKLDVIINAYDNGKSTGACRKVFNNEILGPSDLRKNQMTLFNILYKDQLRNQNSLEYKLYNLFELRFTARNYMEYYEKSLKIIDEIDFLSSDVKAFFTGLIDHFFFDNKNWKKEIKSIDFSDFSLSNIFYASCAALHNNSLEYAGYKMASILKIPNSVHLISNISLMLKAETYNGTIINDEGDIVSWNNAGDKIKRVFLVDQENKEYIPSINEKNELSDCKELINNADIIIFSSGTQWSSLIPTYMHKGFFEIINESKAAKYLILNNAEDYDMYGVDADECLNIINNYVNLQDFVIVINDNASENMNHITSNYKFIHGELGNILQKKHDPVKLVNCIMQDYYKIKKKMLISDLDGTLWSSETELIKKVSFENLKLFEGIIFSGNSYEHVKKITDLAFFNRQNNYIFCDYGNTYFKKNCEVKSLSEEFYIKDNIVEELEKIDCFKGKSFVRGNTIVTIKHLENRNDKIKIVNNLLQNNYGDKYDAHIAGKTSIDIMIKGFNKSKTLKRAIKKLGLNDSDILYFGNEINCGNEECIRLDGYKCLQINDVYEMNMLLKYIKS